MFQRCFVVGELKGDDLAILSHPNPASEAKHRGIIRSLDRHPDHLVAESQENPAQQPSISVPNEDHRWTSVSPGMPNYQFRTYHPCTKSL